MKKSPAQRSQTCGCGPLLEEATIQIVGLGKTVLLATLVVVHHTYARDHRAISSYTHARTLGRDITRSCSPPSTRTTVTRGPNARARSAIKFASKTMSADRISSDQRGRIWLLAEDIAKIGTSMSRPSATAAWPAIIALSQPARTANMGVGRHWRLYSHSPPNSASIVRALNPGSILGSSALGLSLAN